MGPSPLGATHACRRLSDARLQSGGSWSALAHPAGTTGWDRSRYQRPGAAFHRRRVECVTMTAMWPDVPPIEIVLLGRHADRNPSRALRELSPSSRTRSEIEASANDPKLGSFCENDESIYSILAAVRLVRRPFRIGASANMSSCLPPFWLRHAVRAATIQGISDARDQST
jgi:hypothetical protein